MNDRPKSKDSPILSDINAKVDEGRRVRIHLNHKLSHCSREGNKESTRRDIDFCVNNVFDFAQRNVVSLSDSDS